MKKFLLSLMLGVACAITAQADVVSILTLVNNSNVQDTPEDARLGKDNGTSSDPAEANYNVAYGGFNGTKPKVEGAKTWNLWHLGWNQDKFLGLPAGNTAPKGKLTTNFKFEKPLAKITAYLTVPNAGLRNGAVKVYASTEAFPVGAGEYGELVGSATLTDKKQANVTVELVLSNTKPDMYYQLVFEGEHDHATANMLRLFNVNYFAKEDFACSFLDAELFLNETAKLAKPQGAGIPTLFTFTDENGVVEVAEDPEDVKSFLITPKKTGKTTVTASWAENAGFLAGSTTFEVNVKPLVLGDIEAMINGSIAIKNGETYDVKSEANPIHVYAKNATKIQVKGGQVDFVEKEADNVDFTPAAVLGESRHYTITAWMDDVVKTLEFDLNIQTDPIGWSSLLDYIDVVEFDTYTLTFGKPHPAVEFTLNNDNISIDKNKIGFDEHSIVITANAPGETVVTMKWSDDSNYYAGQETFRVVVAEKERAIYQPSFAALGTVIFTDAEMVLDLGEVAPMVNFTSSNEAVAKVELVGSKATITKVGEGTATISCAWERDADFLAGSAQFDVFVPAGKAIVKSGAVYNGSLDKEVAEDAPVDIENFVNISFGSPETAANVFAGSGNIIIEPAKGVTLQKVVFPLSGTFNGYISMAGGEGKATLEGGKVTWVGPASEGDGHGAGTIKINATRSVKVPYFEVYYTQKNPDVRLSFDKTEAGYAIGHGDEFVAPVLSVDVDANVDEAAAKAAVVYHSSNEAIATVAANGEISAVAPGTVTISAFIPDTNTNFFSTVAKYTLTVTDPDREVITAAVMGATATGKFSVFATTHERPNRSEIEYHAVFSKTDEGNMRFFKGGDGWGSGIYVTQNVNGERIESINIVFADGKAGQGVKVYGCNAHFAVPELRTAPVFTQGDVVVEEALTESKEITFPADCYTAFAIVPVASQSEVVLKSVTVKYANQQIKFAKIDDIEGGLEIEEFDTPVQVVAKPLGEKDKDMAEKVNGTEVDKALHYSMYVQASTNASAMKFTFEGNEWIVAAHSGEVTFTAEYLPVPKTTSELQYVALEANGDEILSTKGSKTIKFEHYPAATSTITVERAQVEGRYDVDTYKINDIFSNSYIKDWVLETEDDVKKANRLASKNVIVDVRLTIGGSHTGHPCIVQTSATRKISDTETRTLECEYSVSDKGVHEALLKRVHSFPYDAVKNDAAYVAANIMGWNPEQLSIATHVYFPVVYGNNGPVITESTPTPEMMTRKFFKAADANDVTVEAVKSVRQGNVGASQILTVQPNNIDKVDSDGTITGLEDVLFDAAVEGEAEYFNLQGVRILNPAKGQVVIRRQANGQVDKLRF